ncbi:O-succinylbenzoic acid--CoA ligase [Klebsiella pneumoniae ISC21]|nr:O-succinylbenzoic acid--CoA ligase [Klebsiella pneumoniae ISC21]
MILAHPQVQQVFIVPLDDAEYGQRPVAVVECDDGCELSALAAWSAERLARFSAAGALAAVAGNVKKRRD